MHPPRRAVEALEEIHPTARLGWLGQDRTSDDDELNKGEFVLLQLYRQRQADDFLYFPWRDRGPVFGTDFDRLEWEPLWLANFTKEEVFNMTFLDKVKRWMRPMKERIRESAIARGREVDREIADKVGEYGEMMHRAAQADSFRPPVVANKHLTDEDKSVLSGEKAASMSMENAFLPKDREGRELV